MRAGRIGAALTVTAITAITASSPGATQHHTVPVALHDGGLTIGRTVAPPPSSGVAQFAGDPTAKPAQSPKPPSTHPAAPKTAATTPTPAPPPPPPPPPPPARQVLGFAPYWTLDTWPQWRLQDLSSIAYFGVTIDGNGNTVTDEAWPTWPGQQLSDMVNAAHRAGVKVLVTVRNFDNGEMFSMLGDQTHFHTAVQTATDLMRMRNLDGVVIDFEGSDPGLAPGFVQYAGQVRASIHAVNPNAQLVVATYAGAASGGGGMYDVGALAQNSDALFVMAYDMAGGNDPAHAVSNAPLTGGRYNDTDVVNQYLAKAPADKLILGVPYYGDKWSVSSPDPNAAITDGPAPSTYSQMLSDFGCAQRLTVHQNDATPWATWYSPPGGDPCGANLGAWREVYFETPASLGAKYDLVNRANLLGTGMWALGFDAGHGELWDTLQSHLTPKR
ncbi:MAG TPA: glycosyl hydrolase family 18 protein [Candidatus Angelobacter sp.]|nr:glycosyl hydrolase family 18 protein [Candidatus Angelobacter sp.]